MKVWMAFGERGARRFWEQNVTYWRKREAYWSYVVSATARRASSVGKLEGELGGAVEERERDVRDEGGGGRREGKRARRDVGRVGFGGGPEEKEW